MDKRDEILNEALHQNDQETERWTKYKDEQYTAITNLDAFSKKLEVEVMVPIGSKALMPGRLCHTNEVYVSHYGKLFSKCTAFQAKQISQHRIDMAKNQLEKLSTERELFQNKLYIPHTDGIVANDGEFEIIEKYDEESEKLWQEKHKISVRESKQKEKYKNENLEINHENVMQKLNELELMDELESELNDLGVQDNETLHQLISGQLKITEKKRNSLLNNNKINNSEINGNNDNNDICSINNRPLKEVAILDELLDNKNIDVIKNDVSKNIPENQLDNSNSTDADSDESSIYEIPKEIIAMEEQIEGLSSKEQVQFYKKNIKSIEKEIETMRISNPVELDKKLHKIEIRDYLIDLVSILEDQIEDNDEIDILENVNKQKKIKRITFALEDDIKYIDKSEKVEDMFKHENEKKRDIITLDPEFDLINPKNESVKSSNNVIKKIDSIAEKVEKNFNFVQEMQSHEDFDLVGKILGTEKQKAKTLSIKFHHSNQIFKNPLNNSNNSINKFQLGSPADFYTIFGDKYPQNLNKNKIYNSNNNHNQNERAYTDLRTEVCTLQKQNTMESTKPEICSILKNKESPVMQNINITKTKVKKTVPLNYFDYDTIVGDVVENQISEPEPLPEETFVNTHEPKKRISRFKQSRTMKTV